MPNSNLFWFGPDDAPVGLAGVSPQFKAVVEEVKRFSESGANRLSLLSGGRGTGKTAAAVAVQAESETNGVVCSFLNPGSEMPDHLPRINRGEIGRLIVDGFDELPSTVRESIVKAFTRIPGGCFLTISELGPWIHQEDFHSASHLHLPPLEDRPEDCAPLAEFLWKQVLGNEDAELVRQCDESAVNQLQRGPWIEGVRSLRRCLELLAEQQSTRGTLQEGELITRLNEADLLTALVEMIRESTEQSLGIDRSVTRIVVEGETDQVYLQTAATLCEREWGTNPLEGLLVEPAGADREGGADAVVKTLIALSTQQIPAIGILDNDLPGREARKTAGKFGPPPLLLPKEFDRLAVPPGQDEVEIEDLVALSLLERFYEENEHFMEGRTRIEMGRRVRIVVGGPHKLECSEWVAANATLDDVERILYIIFLIRDKLRFARPAAIPELADWLDRLLQSDS